MNKKDTPKPRQTRRQDHTWIAAYVTSPLSRFFNWCGKHKTPAILWVVSNLLAFGVGNYLKPRLVPWYVEHFTHPHRLDILFIPWRTNQPKCSLATISIAPEEPIQFLHIQLTFAQDIHAIVLQRGYTRHGNNVNINVDSSMPHSTKPPCEISAQAADRDDSLTFTTSSDRHQIFINGHDITMYDTQSLLVALYPDLTGGATPLSIDWDADANYEVSGYSIPITFSFYRLGNDGKSYHMLDTTEHLVKLQ